MKGISYWVLYYIFAKNVHISWAKAVQDWEQRSREDTCVSGILVLLNTKYWIKKSRVLFFYRISENHTRHQSIKVKLKTKKKTVSYFKSCMAGGHALVPAAHARKKDHFQTCAIDDGKRFVFHRSACFIARRFLCSKARTDQVEFSAISREKWLNN